MTIAAVGTQANGLTIDSNANAARAFASNVAAGSLIVISVARYIAAQTPDPFVAGDCTKTAGTATIDTPTLDLQQTFDVGAGELSQVAIFSCLVTAGGSLTMNVAGATGDFWNIATAEYSGTWDSSRVEATSTGSSATDNATPGTTGSATSAGAALFYGAMGLAGSGVCAITEVAPYIKIYEEEDASAHEMGAHEYRIVSVGTTTDASWTLASNHRGYSAALSVYKEAAGGSPPIANPISPERFSPASRGKRMPSLFDARAWW